MTENAAHPLDTLTQQVIDLTRGDNPRLSAVMRRLIGGLHDFVRDVALTEEEWAEAIAFLTDTGRISVGGRQEFILLSDILGVSMLVDALNYPAQGQQTESTVFGPFYTGKQPEHANGASIVRRRELDSPLMHVLASVQDEHGAAVPKALVEVWQTAPNGLYDVQDPDQPEGHLRGTFLADDDGRFDFHTILPVSYPIPDDGPVGKLLKSMGRHPWRPAHIHFMISAPGFRRLVTHLFIAGDPYLDSDAVFGVKPELIVEPEMGADHLTMRYNFVLAPTSACDG